MPSSSAYRLARSALELATTATVESGWAPIAATIHSPPSCWRRSIPFQHRFYLIPERAKTKDSPRPGCRGQDVQLLVDDDVRRRDQGQNLAGS